MKISPKRYIQGFCVIVLALGWGKVLFPSIAYTSSEKALVDSLAYAQDSIASIEAVSEEVAVESASLDVSSSVSEPDSESPNLIPETRNQNPESQVTSDFKPHKIYSVSSFKNAFPDQNDIQLVAARRYGVKPVASQADAEKRKDELVYIGSNPFFYVDPLKSSIPYLVPKAAVLVQDIGKTFFDSLQIKGIPLHKIIVTSVLRSKADVAKLQQRNMNATTQSCHQYGTTVDICYNRYKTVEDPDGPAKRAVTNDTLKWVLSEVLNDFRKNNRCYIKYEVNQSCFHLTVR